MCRVKLIRLLPVKSDHSSVLHDFSHVVLPGHQPPVHKDAAQATTYQQTEIYYSTPPCGGEFAYFPDYQSHHCHHEKSPSAIHTGHPALPEHDARRAAEERQATPVNGRPT